MTTSISQNMTQYPNVDVRAFVQAAKNMSRLALLRTPKLTSIEENARRASAYARELDNAIRTAVPRLAAALRDSASDSVYISSLAEIDEALASLPAGHKTRPALEAERSKISARLAEGARHLVSAFAEQAATLSSCMLDLQRVPIAERVQTVLEEQKQQLARVQQEMSDAEQRRASLVAQRATVIESLNLLRGQNFIDIINDVIPSASELDNLDLTNPKKEAIKQALDLTKKLLGKLSDQLKYADLVEARNTLDGRIDALSDELNAIRGKSGDAHQLLNGLNDALSMAGERTVLLAQAELIKGVWHAFAARLRERLDQGDYAGSIPGMLQGQSAFLDDLSESFVFVNVA